MTISPRILIAEDEPILATHLTQMLLQAWPTCVLLPIAPDGCAALEQARCHLPDVLFLDIQMPGISGLDVVEPLIEDWPNHRAFPLIVYVTAYDQYAVMAFERAAVDYLLKPVTAARLAQTVERLQARLQERKVVDINESWLPSAQQIQQLQRLLFTNGNNISHPSYLQHITASVGKQTRLIPIAEVLYFETADKYIRVVTAREETLIRTPLKDLLPQLDPQQFWQIHRGIAVQALALSHVQRDEAGKMYLFLKDRPERLPVSRLYAERFRAM